MYARQGSDSAFVAWALDMQIVPALDGFINNCYRLLGTLTCYASTLQAPVQSMSSGAFEALLVGKD